MFRRFYLFAVLCLCTLPLTAQQGSKEGPAGDGIVGGVITDSGNEWAITGSSTDDGVLTNFLVPVGTDHQFSTWYWYRVAGDSSENIMPLPDTEEYVGSVATLTWNDVDGRGLFSAELVFFLFGGAAPGGGLLKTLDITNLAGTNLEIDVFSYADMDLDGTAGDDSAVETRPDRIDVVDTSTSFIIGNQVDGYQVGPFPLVRDALNDAVIDDFTNTGLPFGPGDYTGAYQWSDVLAPGATQTFATLNCLATVDECADFIAIFEDGFETGDTTAWDNAVP